MLLSRQLGEALQTLRKDRGLKQRDLYEFLKISQAQYSKIEHGQASLTAEQLIELIKKYNLSLSKILPVKKSEEEASLQNILIKMGAKHLREIPEVMPLSKWDSINSVVFHILATAPSARLLIALVPVLTKNYSQLNLNWINEKLYRQGLERRLAWMIDATFQSIDRRLKEGNVTRELKLIYRRSREFFKRRSSEPVNFFLMSNQEDELDLDLTSQKTINLVTKRRDKLAEKWKIITRIKLKDFYQALKEAE